MRKRLILGAIPGYFGFLSISLDVVYTLDRYSLLDTHIFKKHLDLLGITALSSSFIGVISGLVILKITPENRSARYGIFLSLIAAVLTSTALTL
jgi:hypothetical protein